MHLKDLIKQLREYKGFARKSCIGVLARLFSEECRYDDAGWFKVGDSYVVVSSDGITEDLINDDPFLAGYYSVLVNVNDVVAKGARPMGYAGVLASRSSDVRMKLAEGLREAIRLYDLVLLKVHTHPDTSYDAIDGCVVGVAKKVIPSSTAKPSQKIVVAVDVDGRMGSKGWVCCFDTTRNRTPDHIKGLIDGMVSVAERELASASRDISAPGLLGSLTMLCESSRVGAIVDLNSLPLPKGVGLEVWLKMYPSFGFILVSSEPLLCAKHLERFGYVASIVGEITGDRKVIVRLGDQEETFMNLAEESIFS
ncbi:MAG: AIR synthase-related protein [Candidatus Nezhaarchaeota archaeon]|nr:AIR synthase-related protein [Candidatus Nezhaarchaeota archaeon]